MQALDVAPREDEGGEIIAWRAEELMRAGYDGPAALELAISRNVDLHAAMRLRRRGCPAELALRILL